MRHPSQPHAMESSTDQSIITNNKVENHDTHGQSLKPPLIRLVVSASLSGHDRQKHKWDFILIFDS